MPLRLPTQNTQAPIPTATTTTAQPSQKKKEWDRKSLLAKIYQMNKYEPERAQKLYEKYKTLESDSNSKYYQPYAKATNQAVSNLAALGLDTSNVNDDWFKQNEWLTQYYTYGGTTNSPTKPGKKASAEQLAAYEYNQLLKSRDFTNQVDSQWKAMQDELAYWANRKDLNLSDDEIVNKVRSKMKSHYSALDQLDNNQTPGTILELNHGTDYSLDAMYGTIWAARNKGTSGDSDYNIAMSALGAGNKWQEDQKTRAKLNPMSQEYSPYSVSMTMNDAGAYFNQPYFDQKWLDENQERYLINGSEEDKKFYTQVAQAEQTTKAAEEELAALNDKINQWIADGKSEQTILDSLDRMLRSDNFKTLKSLDDSLTKEAIQTGKSLVSTNRAINFKREEIEKMIREGCANRENGYDYTSDTIKEAVDSVTSAVPRINVQTSVAPEEKKEDGSGIDSVTGAAPQMPYMANATEVEPEAQQKSYQQSGGKKTKSDIIAESLDLVVKSNIQQLPNGEPWDDDLRSNIQNLPGEKGSDDGNRLSNVQQLPNEYVSEDEMREAYDKKHGAGSFDRDIAQASLQAPSDQEKETIKANDKVLQDSVAAVDEELTPSESAQMSKAGSTGWEPMKKMWQSAAKVIDVMKGLANKTTSQVTKSFVETSLASQRTVDNYEKVQADLAADEEAFAQMQAQLGNIDYLNKTFDPSQPLAFNVGDLEFSFRWNEGTKQYELYNISAPGRSGESMEEIIQYGRDDESIAEAERMAKEETAEALKIQKAHEVIEAMGEQGAAALKAYQDLNGKIQMEKKTLEDGAAEYQEKKAALTDVQKRSDMTAFVDGVLGADSTSLMYAQGMTDYLAQFYDEPQLYNSPENMSQLYDYYAETFGIGEMYSKSQWNQMQIQNIDVELEKLDLSAEWVEANNVELPDSIKKNMEFTRHDLLNKRKAYEYAAVLSDTDPQEAREAIAAGRAFEEKYNELAMHQWSNTYPNGDFYTLRRLDRYKDPNNEDDYKHNIITEEEEQLYYYLLGRKVLEMGGNLDAALAKGSTPEAEEAALREVFSDANDYRHFMENADSGYGVWSVREFDESGKWGEELVNSGFAGGLAANLMSTVATIPESVSSIYSALDYAISGKRFNPKDPNYKVTSFKNQTRAATRQSIDDTFGKDTWQAKLANLGYEIYCNRGDSAMNAMVFGSLLGSVGIGMVDEFLGAAPMGATAAMNAAMQAVENGASTDQAWLIAGITFLAETGTEAITLSNIKDAAGFQEALSGDSLKGIVTEWLTKSGVEELIGESANDAIENWASRYAAEKFDNPNYQSEHDQLVQQALGKYDPNDPERYEKAEADAYNEEVNGILHTALVSYLSAGADVVVSAGKAAVNSYNQARTETQGTDQSAINRMFQELKNKKTGADLATEQAFAEEEKERAVAEAVQENENEKSYATEIEIIESAMGSNDASARTAAAASVLAIDESDIGSDQANAAAVHVEDTFENGMADVQDLLYGAMVSNVNPAALKRGLQFATLGGENSACRQLVESEEYKNATPDRKAQMLAEAARTDNWNQQVNQEVTDAVRENRIAEKEKDLIAQGGLSATQKAQARADNAAIARQQAEKDLAARQDEAAAAAQAVSDAVEANNAEPSDENAKQVISTTADLSKKDESARQYEQHLENTKQDQEQAEKELSDTKQKELTDIRQQAEQMVAQEDQQRNEVEAQRAEQRRIREEVRAKAEQAQMETNNVTRMDADEFTEKYFSNVSDEDKVLVKQAFTKVRREMGMTADKFLERGKFAKGISKKFGVNITFEDTTQGGKYAPQNAHVDMQTGNIVMDRNASMDDMMYAVLTHELTHIAEKSNTYGELADAILQMTYGDNNITYQGIIDAMNGGDMTSQMAQDVFARKTMYDTKLGREHSYEEALQEVVADGMGKILSGDQKLIDQLVTEKPSIARRIVDSIKSFLKKMVGIEGTPMTQAQKVVDMLETALNEAQIKRHNDQKYLEKPKTREDKLQMLKDIRDAKVSYDKGSFRIETIPSVYTNLFNVGELDLTMSPRHSYNIMATADEAKAEGMYRKGYSDHYHGLGPDGLLEAIDALDDPSVIMDARGKDKKASPRIAMVINTKNNGPLLAVIDFYSNDHIVDGDDKRTHALLTIYDKNNIDQYIQTAIDQNKVLYVNQEQGHFGATVQFGSGQSNPAFDNNLAQFNEYVNRWKENRGIKYSLPDNTLVADENGNPLVTELPGDTAVIDDDTRFSLSSFTPEEQQKVRKALLDTGNYTEQQVDKYMSDALGLASMIAADRNRLDFDADQEKSMVKPNSDYGASIDASTLCAKRLVYQGTFDAIQHLLPNTPLMPEDLIDLANLMREMGYETPCGICYVESRRRNLDKEASKWLESYKGEYKPTLDQLTTSDGLEQLRNSKEPGAKDAYNAFLQAMKDLNQRNPKVVQLRTEYRGEIRDMTDNAVQKAINHGGLRLQSFSDFETPHLLDMVQVVYDMASKGLTSQAYTKVPNFAWAFGDTGIKINLSLIGKGTGVDADGNLIFDDVEGMKFDEAMKLRDRYSKNVGTILVGMNDAHIKAAMADDRIDFIIPFHRSGWTNTELAKMPVLESYTDYQNDQNEKKIIKRKENGKGYETMAAKDSKLKNFEPVGENGYWDFSKTGKENAEEYLRLCAEDGRVPKFSQFLVDNGDGSFSLQPDGSTDGYWKTLIDFKMYDNEGVGSPQTAVTPNVNMDQAIRILNDYSLEREMPNGMTVSRGNNNEMPVAQPVVERYVEEFKAKHPLDENRIRYSLPEEINPDYSTPDGDPATNAAVEESDVNIKYSLRMDEPPKKTIKCYKAFYARDGKLYPPMVSNNTNEEDLQKVSKATSGTMKGLETPVGVWLNADVGGIAVDENGEPLRTKTTGRLQVKNDKSGGNAVLAYRPGWHLGEWPDATQFYKTDPVTGKPKSVMPDDLVFAECEIAADIDYQLEALELGVTEKGGFNRTQAGLPRIPVDGYYKYRTNANPAEAPWYISGAMKVNRILTDEECRQECAKHGVTPAERYSHHDINLEDYGLKAGEVTPSDNLERFEKNQASYDNDALLDRALNDDRYSNAYVRRALNFNDPTLLNEFAIDRISQEQVEKYRSEYQPPANTKFSLAQDAPYMAAVERGEMDEAQKMVDEAAKNAGYNVEGYHGTDANFTEFKYGDIGYHIGTEAQARSRMDQAGERSMQSDRKSKIMHLYAKLENPLQISMDFGDWHGKNVAGMLLETEQWEEGYDENAEEINARLEEIARMPEGTYTDKVLREFLQSLGYDGIEYENEFEDVDRSEPGWANDFDHSFIVFNPSQLKLADPVTYDDHGNVIPLSERFNTQQKDIRYSLPSDNILEEQIRFYLANGGNMTQEDIDAYDQKNSRPLEGKSVKWTQAEGPAQRQFGGENGMLQQSDELDQTVIDYISKNNAYFPDTNASQVKRAVNWIRSLGTKAEQANQNAKEGEVKQDAYSMAVQKVTSKSFDYRSADGQARMIAVMALAAQRNDVAAQVQLADAFNRQGTDLGRSLQSRKLFKLMTPEGRISTLQKMLGDQQAMLDAKGKNVDLKFSDWIYQAAAVATEEGDMQKVQAAAAQELAEQIPANWKDRLNTIRMLSMLANPRTHIRNVIGNAMFIPAVSLKNKMSAVMELGVKQGDKTKTLAPILSREIRNFARQDANAIKDVLTGEAKYNEANQIKQNQAPLGKFVKVLSDFNSNALEKEDWIFLKGHYRRALGGWMQANGYTAEQLQNDQALLEKGRAYAIDEAQKATYRDFNEIAHKLNEWGQNTKSFGGKTFALGIDAVLPFKKTPANILRRGIEYSPIGLAKSLTVDAVRMKRYMDYQNGKLNALPDNAKSPTQVIDNLCAGLSGTAITALGFLLAGCGAVSCGLDDDEDKFEKAKGNQEYAVRFKLFGQDVTFTMDWAAPMSMPFFVGAAIREQMENEGGVDIEEALNAFGAISEPVFNLSMLDGVNTLFKTSSYDDTNAITQILSKVLTNYASSFVPSALGAVARTIDDTRRKSFVEQGKATGVMGNIRYALENAQNKIPFYNQENIPVRDIWGNKDSSELVERILENFILPGYINEYKEDPIINEMGRLYEATGDKGMIPEIDPAKYYEYTKYGEKHKVVFTDKQWDQYKEVRGQTAFNELTELINSDEYQKADNAAQVQMIKNVWTHANMVGLQSVIPELDVEEVSIPALAKDSRISTNKSEMIKALNAGDYDAYDTMVEALREDEVEDSAIKEKISDTYRNQYKDAYRKGDYIRMTEIEELLDNTGFDFDYYKWQKDVDEKYGK